MLIDAATLDDSLLRAENGKLHILYDVHANAHTANCNEGHVDCCYCT